MKKNHLTKLLISAAMLTVGLAAQAQVYSEFSMTGKNQAGVQYTPHGVDLNKMDKHQYGNMTVYTPKHERRAAKKAESGEVTLTFNLVYDSDVLMPSNGVTIINENYCNYAYFEDEDAVTATIPPGTYDFVAQFESMETGDQYYVIREQVAVTESATFTLSAEEATNRISFVNYSPKGNVLMHDWLLDFDEETDEPIILEEGEIDCTKLINIVYLKGVGNFGLSSNAIEGPLPEAWRAVPFSEYYVNDVSDRYLFTQSRICSKGTETWYLSYFSTDDVHAGVVKNKSEDYVLCHEEYQFSPYGKSEIGYGAGMTVYHLEDGSLLSSSGITGSVDLAKQGDAYSVDVYSSIPFEDPKYKKLNLLAGIEFVDKMGVVRSPFGYERRVIKDKAITSSFANENGFQVFHNIGHFNSDGILSGKTLSFIDNEMNYFSLPSPVAFTYPSEKRLGTVGDNCPINAVNIMSFYNEDDGDVMSFGNNYMGCYGESRIYDNAELTETFKFNGQEVEAPDERESKGIWEYSVTNNNIEVDGLPGMNKTMIYYDETKEECTCPSIEMLQFKSDAGVTNRFDTSVDGVMEFMGGDFRYTYYPELWDGAYDKCQSMDVTVEYSPYGEENWKELPIEEVPELYQDGWGNFYRASLANVNGKATQGWFDLRFKLKNEAGNWQEQVVSPAFRIDDQVMTAVEDVDIATDATVVARYSVDGRAISAPQPGLNIVKMSNGTSKKIWVK